MNIDNLAALLGFLVACLFIFGDSGDPWLDDIKDWFRRRKKDV